MQALAIPSNALFTVITLPLPVTEHEIDGKEHARGDKRFDIFTIPRRPWPDIGVSSLERVEKRGFCHTTCPRAKLERRERDTDVLNGIAPTAIIKVKRPEDGAIHRDVPEMQVGVEESEIGRIGIERNERLPDSFCALLEHLVLPLGKERIRLVPVNLGRSPKLPDLIHASIREPGRRAERVRVRMQPRQDVPQPIGKLRCRIATGHLAGNPGEQDADKVTFSVSRRDLRQVVSVTIGDRLRHTEVGLLDEPA
jgi:hypothetical protein